MLMVVPVNVVDQLCKAGVRGSIPLVSTDQDRRVWTQVGTVSPQLDHSVVRHAPGEVNGVPLRTIRIVTHEEVIEQTSALPDYRVRVRGKHLHAKIIYWGR